MLNLDNPIDLTKYPDPEALPYDEAIGIWRRWTMHENIKIQNEKGKYNGPFGIRGMAYLYDNGEVLRFGHAIPNDPSNNS
jgi:hypothetical protein